MEVKVDVHVDASPLTTPAKNPVRDPYGPWCRPEAKPSETFTDKHPVSLNTGNINIDDSIIQYIDDAPNTPREFRVPKVCEEVPIKRHHQSKPKQNPRLTRSSHSSSKAPDDFNIKDTSIELHEIVRRSLRRKRRRLAHRITNENSKLNTDTIDEVIEVASEDVNNVNSQKSFDSIDSFKESISLSSSKRDLELGSLQSPVPTVESSFKYYKGVFHLFSICDSSVPIDPQGRSYISWLAIVTICYSYNSWCITLRTIFPYQTPENTPIWMTFDYLCDLVYFLDVSYVKPRLMFLEDGFWVRDPKTTKKNYRSKLQYKLDVLSLLPFDILYIYFGTQQVILRAPRLLKLQTFWEFHQAMDRILSSPYVVRIGKSLYYIFFLIHLNACAYYSMSVYEGLASNGWVYDNQGNAYLRCFYFATKTATSIGKNPKPELLGEYVFMTTAWLMGVFVFAVLIGQIRDIVATANRAKEEYRLKLDTCTKYLRKLNLPNYYQRRVAAWFQYTWKQQRCFDESQILSYLPHNMRLDVALEVHMEMLSKVQIFRDCSDSLLRDLVLQLRPVTFLPGDVVVRRGDVGHHMYIIKSGQCLVLSEDECEVLATLKEGSVFGEISLLGIEGLRRRTATVRSSGFSSLFALSRSALASALRHHHEAARILKMRADLIIQENAAREGKSKEDCEGDANSPTLSARQRRISNASGSGKDDVGSRRDSSTSMQIHSQHSVTQVEDMKPSSASPTKENQTPIPSIDLSLHIASKSVNSEL